MAVITHENFIEMFEARVKGKLETHELDVVEHELQEALRGLTLTGECTAITPDTDRMDSYSRMIRAKMKLQGKSLESAEQYIGATSRMVRYLCKRVEDITRLDVQYYLAMLGEVRSTSYVISTKTYINCFYTFLIDENIVPVNPVRNVLVPKPEPRSITYLNEDEILKFQDVAQKGLERSLIDVCLSTGLRVGELINIKIEDIDFVSGGVKILSEKSNNYRIVFLVPRARKSIKEYLEMREDNCPYLFVGRTRRKDANGNLRYLPLSKESVEKITKTVGEKAGVLKHCTVHLLRRTFATRLINNGCPVEVVQKLLGHKSSSTTLEYYAEMEAQTIRRTFMQYVQY